MQQVFTHAAGEVQLICSKQCDVLPICPLRTCQLPEFPALHLFAPRSDCQRLFVCLFLTRVSGKMKEVDLYFNTISESLSMSHIVMSALWNVNYIFSNFN